ncbi:MAG: hypothetical protein ABI310_09720, partial [Microbacteriaceae bacterium]
GQYDAASATLDAALMDALAREDVWWLPEVMRMRAAYDNPEAAVARLQSSVALARRQGSVGHIRRIEQDLAERGVRVVGTGVRSRL